MANEDLKKLTETADKLADGMTINREAHARDIKRLVSELTFWRNEAKRNGEKKEPPKSQAENFSDVFEGLFGGKKWKH